MKKEKKGENSKVRLLGKIFSYLLVALGLTGFYFFTWFPIIEASHTFH